MGSCHEYCLRGGRVTKKHFINCPCGARSTGETIAEHGMMLMIPMGKRFEIPEGEVYLDTSPLPQTDNWLEVTCKKCLRLKPND